MKNRGFTLVELLIVVIILGILAAVVIPQFTDASTETRMSSLAENLQIVRKQLDIYRTQHANTYPANFVNGMTSKTDIDGTVNASGKYGPYMQKVPMNPFTVGGTGNDVTNSAAAANKAWYYDSATGEFKANDGGTTNGVAHDSL